MTLRKGSILFILSFFICSSVYSQYTEDDGGIESKNGYLRYLGLGAAATYQVMNDAAISPIEYTKIGAQPMLTQMKVSPLTFTEFQFKASILNLTHNRDNTTDRHVKTKRAAMDYRFLYKMPVESRVFDIRAGVLLSGMFTHKRADHLIDAYRVYEYAASLGLCGKITSEIVLGDNTGFFSWDLGMPLVANVSRPFYLNREEFEDPETKPISDFLGNSETGSFGKYFRLISRVSLMYRLENGNIVQLSYQWDYSKLKTINSVYFTEHMLSLLFMFNY